MHDVEAIERATLAAVPPQALEEHAGWLLALDPGTVGRSHSAVPLQHSAPAPGQVAAVEARYAARSLSAVWRIPQVPAFDGLRAQLAAQGYRSGSAVAVQVACTDAVLAALPASTWQVELAGAPDNAWAQVCLGEALAPADAASRLAILRRGRASSFAAARDAGRLVAVGSAVHAHGWCGLHGLRTLPDWRGQGLATAIMGALLRAARGRGLARAFLQVEQDNASACRLYARLGFTSAWSYAYWRKP